MVHYDQWLALKLWLLTKTSVQPMVNNGRPWSTAAIDSTRSMLNRDGEQFVRTVGYHCHHGGARTPYKPTSDSSSAQSTTFAAAWKSKFSHDHDETWSTLIATVAGCLYSLWSITHLFIQVVSGISPMHGWQGTQSARQWTCSSAKSWPSPWKPRLVRPENLQQK